MWVLSHTKTGCRLYILANTRKYGVGRQQQSPLYIEDDTSVSREHAVIHRSSAGIRVEDLGSKYGTYVSNGIDLQQPIEKNVQVDLKTGDIVRFGRLDSIYRLENIEFNVCTSTMTQQEINKLKNQLKLINGTFHSAWSTECTHLVMSNVTVTVKVLQSLANGIPIVSPSYFDALIEHANENRLELPNVKKFIPEIIEPYIIKEPHMMEVHLDRQRLFQNKTFVFMVKKHMNQYEPIIKLAAGKCINMETDKFRKSALLKPEYIPVQYVPSENTEAFSDVDSIVQYIQSHSRRLIGETEIGLAIIHRATDRFCNPDRRMLTDFEPNGVGSDEILKNVLQEETPTVSNKEEKPVASSTIIPESITPSTEPNNNIRHDDIIDLDKPSTSAPRRSTRSSTIIAAVNSTNSGPILTTMKVPTPKKNPKRKAEQPANCDGNANPGGSTPQKKQKTADPDPGEGSSTQKNFNEPMPSSSANVLNFSGFISTQNRKQKDPSVSASQFPKPAKVVESTVVVRKRALNMLNADSDDDGNDDNDNDNDGVFNFNQRSKRAKKSSNEPQPSTRGRGALNKNSDDDDEEMFNFSKQPSQARQKRTKSKPTQNHLAENDELDGCSVPGSQNYKKPFKHDANRSFARFARPQIDVTSTTNRNTDWITCKMKKELNLNDSSETQSEPQPSTSNGAVKKEKLEEWEMTDAEQKQKWIKSLANVFQVRTIEVNQLRRAAAAAADETDSFFLNSGNTTHNKSKNFKKFVKKNNYIPHTTVIKTVPVPITISAFARI